MRKRLLIAYYKVRDIAAIALIPIVCYTLWVNSNMVSLSKDNTTTKAALDSMTTQAIVYKNKTGALVVENIALEAQNEGALRELSAEIFDLKDKQAKTVKEVAYLSKVTQEASLKSVRIKYDTNWIAPVGMESGTIKVPKLARWDSAGAKIRAIVMKDGLLMEELLIKNDLWQRGIEKKAGFLGMRRETTVQAINSSPFLVNTGIATFTVKQEPNAWNRWIKPTVAALAGGFIGYQIAK